MPGDVGEQLADPAATLSMAAELPRRHHHLADVVELRRLDLKDAVRIAAVKAFQHRLMVERIDLADAAVHIEEDDVASAGRMVNARGSLSFGEERREGDGAEAAGTGAQHVAAGGMLIHRSYSFTSPSRQRGVTDASIPMLAQGAGESIALQLRI